MKKKKKEQPQWDDFEIVDWYEYYRQLNAQQCMPIYQMMSQQQWGPFYQAPSAPTPFVACRPRTCGPCLPCGPTCRPQNCSPVIFCSPRGYLY